MGRARVHDLGGGRALPGVVDLFIGSVSYEDRCMSVARWLKTSEVRLSIIAENMNHVEFHRGNGERLRGYFPGCMAVNLDTASPLRTADGLRAALDEVDLPEDGKVVVDITTFTHEALLILFQLVRRRFRRVQVIYAYASAREYAYGLAVEEKWLSRGVEDVRSVLGYPGTFRPSRKLHLIVLVGFEHERIGELISQYEPSLVSLGYGEPGPRGTSDHIPSAILGFGRLKALYGGANEFSFPCFDPIATKEVLKGTTARHPKYNVIIAALNTKLSTLGAALAAIENEEVQLCYAQAVLYNIRRYSLPGDDLYLFSCAD